MTRRIGINLLYINPKLAGGSVTYAIKVISELSKLDKVNKYFVFINKDCINIPFDIGENFTVKVLNFSYRSVYLRYFWEQMILPFYLVAYRIDLVHSLGYVTPLICTSKKIVSILDINYRGHVNNMSLHKRFLLGTMVYLSAKVSKKIITISEFSKQQIIKHTNTAPDKIVVTLLSGSSDLLANDKNIDVVVKKYKINASYIIAFSSPSPHKNIARLIESFNQIRKKFPKLLLVLVGHQSKSNDLVNLINKYDLTNNVIFTGFVPDEDVNPLITGAKMFVFPSLYEGFGIPLLDAQNCKVAVVSSNAGSLPEVGGNSVKYFEPYNVEDITNAISSFLENESIMTNIINLGTKNRAKFSWYKTALETHKLYMDTLSVKTHE